MDYTTDQRQRRMQAQTEINNRNEQARIAEKERATKQKEAKNATLTGLTKEELIQKQLLLQAECLADWPKEELVALQMEIQEKDLKKRKEANEKLTCLVCQERFDDTYNPPIDNIQCSHRICKPCFTGITSHKYVRDEFGVAARQNCPMCRTQFAAHGESVYEHDMTKEKWRPSEEAITEWQSQNPRIVLDMILPTEVVSENDNQWHARGYMTLKQKEIKRR